MQYCWFDKPFHLYNIYCTCLHKANHKFWMIAHVLMIQTPGKSLLNHHSTRFLKLLKYTHRFTPWLIHPARLSIFSIKNPMKWLVNMSDNQTWTGNSYIDGESSARKIIKL